MDHVDGLDCGMYEEVAQKLVIAVAMVVVVGVVEEV